MYFEKKYIYMWIWMLCIWVIIFMLSWWKKESWDVLSQEVIVSEKNDGNYFNNSAIVTTASWTQDDMQKRFEEEWKIVRTVLNITSTGLIFQSEAQISMRKNVQMEVKIDDNQFTQWEQLNISIPWAQLNSIMTIPGRYKYSLFFSQPGNQVIQVYWNNFPGWMISTYVNVK